MEGARGDAGGGNRSSLLCCLRPGTTPLIRLLHHPPPPCPAAGLFPIFVRPSDGRFASAKITFGALGDSFYEYLLKVWLQGGKQEGVLRILYDNAMDGLARKLFKVGVGVLSSTPPSLRPTPPPLPVFTPLTCTPIPADQRSSPSSLLYIADLDGGRTLDKMDHLACFTSGVWVRVG